MSSHGFTDVAFPFCDDAGEELFDRLFFFFYVNAAVLVGHFLQEVSPLISLYRETCWL